MAVPFLAGRRWRATVRAPSSNLSSRSTSRCCRTSSAAPSGSADSARPFPPAPRLTFGTTRRRCTPFSRVSHTQVSCNSRACSGSPACRTVGAGGRRHRAEAARVPGACGVAGRTAAGFRNLCRKRETSISCIAIYRTVIQNARPKMTPATLFWKSRYPPTRRPGFTPVAA